jgi:hypothetical protein
MFLDISSLPAISEIIMEIPGTGYAKGGWKSESKP